MRLWRWFWRLGWGWKIPLLFIGMILVTAAGYVALRGVQYAAADRDAGAYVPAGVQGIVRVQGLAEHWQRILESPAWQTIQGKILRDRSFRRQANAFLKEEGLPTLEDLDDERKGVGEGMGLVLEVAGRDAVVAATLEDPKRIQWCAATHVGFLHYLALPFAGWVLPSEGVGDRRVFRVSRGSRPVYVSLEDAVAVASSSKELLVSALKRNGSVGTGKRPIEGRVDFTRSRLLVEAQRWVRTAGLLPSVRAEAIGAATFSFDISGAAVVADLVLEGAEPLHSDEPPHRLARFIPAANSGFQVTPTGLRDVHALLKFMVDPSSRPGRSTSDAATLLRTLDVEGGFPENVLSRVDDGLVVVSGAEDQGGTQFPCIALLIATRDPKGAADGMAELILKIGKTKEAFLKALPVGDVELRYWHWPGSVWDSNSWLRPCFAPLDGAFLLANNLTFAEAVVRAAAGEGKFVDSPLDRALLKKLREYGFKEAPPLAGGVLFPPQVGSSFDRVIMWLARWNVDGEMTDAARRAQLEMELRQQGRSLSSDEVFELFKAAKNGRYQEEEADLRGTLRVLDRVSWLYWEASSTPKGIALKVVAELATAGGK